MNGTELYAKMSPVRLFLTIAIPGAISMIASSMWGIFDGIFVGQILGEVAFAALNLAFPFVLLIFALADLVGVGASVSISVLLGKQDNENANNHFTCACIMIFTICVITGAVFYFISPVLMQWMGAEGTLLQMSTVYLQVYAVTAPLTSMIFAVDNFLRICGKIKSSMILNIIMSVLILGLEYLFLAVFKMGIAGSALAVSVGMFVCTLIALWPFIRGKLTLKFVKPRPDLQLIGQIVASGSPNFLNNIAGRTTSVIMNAVLLRNGGPIAVGVYGILVYIGDILQQLLYGICDGVQPAIGYNSGAGRADRVKRLFYCSVVACAVISLSGMGLVLLFPESVVSVFVRQSEAELITMAAYAIRIYGFTFLTRWLGFVIQSLFVALEKPVQASILSVSQAFVLPVALLPVLWPLDLDGIWLNAPITALVVAVVALLLYLRLRIWTKQQ